MRLLVYLPPFVIARLVLNTVKELNEAISSGSFYTNLIDRAYFIPYH